MSTSHLMKTCCLPCSFAVWSWNMVTD